MMATSLLSDLNQWSKTRMASEPSKSFTSYKPAPNLLRHSRTRHGRRRIIGLVMDFAFLTFFTERGYEGRTLLWFLALLFFESVFVAAAARPDQAVPTFLHFAIIRSYHSHLPQPAILMFSASLCLLVFRFAQFHRATDSGMFWSLVLAWLGFH